MCTIAGVQSSKKENEVKRIKSNCAYLRQLRYKYSKEKGCNKKTILGIYTHTHTHTSLFFILFFMKDIQA